MSALNYPRRVVIVIGTGGMGLVIARRLGFGRRLILADYSQKALDTAATTLQRDGHNVDTKLVDVSSHDSVLSLASYAAAAGPIESIVHTAGVSPAQASTEQILNIDLLGTANVIDAFRSVVSAGTSMVAIASLAGHTAQLSPQLEQHLALAPLESLLQHKEIDAGISAIQAYMLAKRANQLRVQAESRSWGMKGGRINTISPGVISTAMGHDEMKGEASSHVRQLIEISAAGRVGTADDIAEAVAFLAGPNSNFITGNDILVDGGAFSAQVWAGKNV